MCFRTTLLLNITGLFCIFLLSEAQLPEWKIPCGAPYKPLNCENTSLDALLSIDDFERCGPALLETTAREYVWGAAGDESTFFDNKGNYLNIFIRGERLRGFPDGYSLETTIFGRTIPLPIGVSPTAGHEIYNPQEREIGTVKGAVNAGAVFVLDSYSLTSLEAVAASVPQDSELWMQTEIFTDRQITLNVIRRAEAAGYKAIVLTVDELYFVDIRCNARINFVNKYDIFERSPNLNDSTISNTGHDDITVNFEAIAWLAQRTELPLIVKGILTAEEALGAMGAGAAGIFVSNQGGRELNNALATIDALVAIAPTVKAEYPHAVVIVDGGVRHGHDVFKAMARGADLVFVGRPIIWGLTIGGEDGVGKVIAILREGFKNAMLHAGNIQIEMLQLTVIICMKILVLPYFSIICKNFCDVFILP